MDDTLLSKINEDVDRLKRLTTDTGLDDLNGELSSYAVAHAGALVALAEEAFLSEPEADCARYDRLRRAL